MVLLVLAGTYFVLRLSFSPVAHQYQSGLQRTAQRIASEFETLEGRITFENTLRHSPDQRGLPISKLPLVFLNVIPGHIEELKPLAACSYSSKLNPKDQICAGVLENRSYGALTYVKGSFGTNETLTSPIYTKSPASGHHFLISIDARGYTKKFIITFDPVQRPEPASKSIFSPAWSVTGFRVTSDSTNSYSRDPDIKGRILTTSDSSSRYEFILQIPIYAYAEDALSEQKPWPPSDLTDARITLKLLSPNLNGHSKTLIDSQLSEDSPNFSFAKMSEYLSQGEVLRFSAPGWISNKTVEVSPASSKSSQADHNISKKLIDHVSDVVLRYTLPNTSVKKLITLQDGSSISIEGNASVVLGGWREAAQAIIAFACLLTSMLIISAFIVNKFVVVPLNRVRKNTLYMRGKFSDIEDFKLPHTIKNKHDEVGVLWASILDLHQSITSYGRKALERTKRESDLLRALGHEIRSPLQDLLLRHNDPNDSSTRSVKRISHAVKILSDTYAIQGTGIERDGPGVGPKEAIDSLAGNITREDVAEYLRNAADSDDAYVIYDDPGGSLFVNADADMLEGALTAILNNANDFRTKGTPVIITTHLDSQWVIIAINNTGPHITQNPIDEIFQYGVSSRSSTDDHQGLGLFIAKQYINKMDGDLTAINTESGVKFEIRLARAH